MQLSDYKAFGGGGKKPKRETINRRTLSYIEKKLKTSPEDLKPQDRQNIIFVLATRFEYNTNEILRIIPTSRATLYRDLERAKFMQNRSARLKRATDEVYNYIIYIDRYM